MKPQKIFFHAINKMYRITDKNADFILFPLCLGALLFTTAIILAAFSEKLVWLSEKIISLSMFSFGFGGLFSAVKREIPGDPAARGSVRSIILGTIFALISFGFGIGILFVKK